MQSCLLLSVHCEIHDVRRCRVVPSVQHQSDEARWVLGAHGTSGGGPSGPKGCRNRHARSTQGHGGFQEHLRDERGANRDVSV